MAMLSCGAWRNMVWFWQSSAVRKKRGDDVWMLCVNCAECAMSIRSRVRALDFGQAFYLTTSFEQAGVFDIWENEQVTGSPLRSGYLKAV